MAWEIPFDDVTWATCVSECVVECVCLCVSAGVILVSWTVRERLLCFIVPRYRWLGVGVVLKAVVVRADPVFFCKVSSNRVTVDAL